MAIIPFYGSLTVPAGTASTSPVEETVRTAPGTLKLVRLYVPPGPRGEVSLWLLHQRHQFAPVPPSTWNKMDGDNYSFPFDLVLPQRETDITLVGISPDANFEHTIDFECLVDTEPDTPLPQTSASLTGRLLSALGMGGQ